MEPLETFPHINVPWDQLEDAATDMGTRAGTTMTFLQDTQTAWKRLPGAYEHDETQATVYAALDDLTTPVEDWSAALGKAKNAICDFVDTGRKLQKKSEELERLRGDLEFLYDRDPDGEPPALAVLSNYNERSQQLRSAWKTAQSTAVDALDGISIGDGDTLPMSQALHCSILPTVSWAAFTSGVDKDFPTVRLNGLLASLRGMYVGERQSWVDARPEAAAFLAGNKLKAGSAEGSPEAIMMAAKKDNADLTREGIAGIRKAWMGLSEKDQERLLLLHPSEFGNLNGVPMGARATANIITVAGYRQNVRDKRKKLGAKPVLSDYPTPRPGPRSRSNLSGQSSAFKTDSKAWHDEMERLDTLEKGLDSAREQKTQVVTVSLEGDGRVVSMNGAPPPRAPILFPHWFRGQALTSVSSNPTPRS